MHYESRQSANPCARMMSAHAPFTRGSLRRTEMGDRGRHINSRSHCNDVEEAVPPRTTFLSHATANTITDWLATIDTKPQVPPECAAAADFFQGLKRAWEQLQYREDTSSTSRTTHHNLSSNTNRSHRETTPGQDEEVSLIVTAPSTGTDRGVAPPLLSPNRCTMLLVCPQLYNGHTHTSAGRCTAEIVEGCYDRYNTCKSASGDGALSSCGGTLTDGPSWDHH